MSNPQQIDQDVSERSLAEWLDYQQRIHPRDVELGLERVGEVWRRMGAPRPAPLVITIGGTNGKGSTVAFLEAMLAAAGKRVGAYTSPHLLRYNERVCVARQPVGDAELIDAFGRIDQARAGIPLTYFESGTLAALWIFARANLDVALLEVGLGGRLDAVNIVDADVAIVTSVDLDHMDWLGNDRESIGREKAGIFRANQPAVIGFRGPPDSVLAEASRVGARPIRAGLDYEVTRTDAGWRWRAGEVAIDLPMPRLAAACQIDNAAAAIAALYALRERLGWDPRAIGTGVAAAYAPARLQRIAREGDAELIIDVGHNPQAARVLSEWLAANPLRGRTLAVYGALADKDVAGVAGALSASVSMWFLGGLDGDSPRGLPATELASRMSRVSGDMQAYPTVTAALAAATTAASPQDRVLAFGSFFVATAALNYAQQDRRRHSVAV